MPKGLGGVQKKVLLLLAGGVALSLSATPRRYFKVLSAIGREWESINKSSLRRAIRSLYQSKLVKQKFNADGSITLVLSNQGHKKALTYDLDNLSIIKPRKWDGKWRVIVFDIPEKQRKIRDALRTHLRRLDFYELQKSVFISPYECGDVIEFLIEFYNIRRSVRQILAKDLDNSLDLRSKFDLL